MKKVQIDYELFRKLIFYHLCSDAQYEEEIRNGLEEKLDALVRHELYTKYKTAPSEEVIMDSFSITRIIFHFQCSRI